MLRIQFQARWLVAGAWLHSSCFLGGRSCGEIVSDRTAAPLCHFCDVVILCVQTLNILPLVRLLWLASTSEP